MLDAKSAPTVDGVPPQPRASPAEMRVALQALHPDAWGWAQSCCGGDDETAAEALQDAYLAILDGRARWRRASSLQAFVFGVIQRCARGAGRRAAIRASLFAPLEMAADHKIEAVQEDAASARRVVAAMSKLSPRQRDVAELVLIFDFTVTEAALSLGMPRGSVSRHYADAKRRLRRLLKIELRPDASASEERR